MTAPKLRDRFTRIKAIALSGIACIVGLGSVSHSAHAAKRRGRAADIAAPMAGRQRISMDADWRFHIGEMESPIGRDLTDWQWKADARGEASASDYTGDYVDTHAAGWSVLAGPEDDVFQAKPGFAWFRTTVSGVMGVDARLYFFEINDNATVYVNGKRMAYRSGPSQPFDVDVANVWRTDKPNVIAVLIENVKGKGWLGGVALTQTIKDADSGPAAAAYSDRDWSAVHLPHDYQLDGPSSPAKDRSHAFRTYQIAWYRKTFTVPAADAGKKLYLDFDGVYRNSCVYLNGHLLGSHKSGYTSFEYDVTDAVHLGAPNVLSVRVDPREWEGWWYEGGGIYRHVWLVKTAPLHVAHWGTYVVSTIPGSDKVTPASADVTVTTTLENSDKDKANCQLVSEIVGPDGKTVAAGTESPKIGGGKTQDVTQHFAVANPALWSPDQPHLYQLVTTVEKDGQTIDRVATPFGIRTIAFDAAHGFFLNGKRVEIQGMCNHANFAVVGTALPDNIEPWRISKLKASGCNAYRTAHDPQASELLDACDQLGMLVMDENRHFGDTYSQKTVPGTPYSDLSDLRDMILRDRNHPSIILWSMYNEEPIAHSQEAVRIMAAMRDVVRSVDKTRPVTSAMIWPWGVGTSLAEDVQGFNGSAERIPAFHEKFPDTPSFGSERAGAVMERGVYMSDLPKGYYDAYSLKRTAEATWLPMGERPYMGGEFIWTGWDYQGESFGWPSISSHFGMIDLCGFPKDDYYYYLSWWQDKPVVHLMPHWNWPGQEGKPIAVWCYSNCDKVELFLNGVSLGAQNMPRLSHLAWQVPYAPGKLEAKGYTNGMLTASDAVETTGAATQFAAASEPIPFRANGEDLALVTVEMRDAQGRFVPTADNALTFTVAGPATLMGTNNGNPNDHTPNASAERKAFSGRCLLVLRATDTPGDVTVTVTSNGLPTATLILSEK